MKIFLLFLFLFIIVIKYIQCLINSRGGYAFIAKPALKLYRCPVCGCVIRLRPSGYFKRFQAKIKTIRSSISHKEKQGKWLSGILPTRQRHWFRALQRRIKAYLSNTWTHGLLKAFDHFMTQDQVPVTRSI